MPVMEKLTGGHTALTPEPLSMKVLYRKLHHVNDYMGVFLLKNNLEGVVSKFQLKFESSLWNDPWIRKSTLI